jgi:superfamily II DNA/RNA helicase
VFVLFKQEAKALAKMLVSEGYNAFAMQGNMSQSSRAKTLQSFRDAPSAVLVATDLAARGLDVQGVSHVINFSLGLSMDSYVHRIGRCGRADRKGVAVSFVTDGDERHAQQLVQVLEQARQPVPPGLREMALSYDRNSLSPSFMGLTVKSSGERGESRAVLKTAPANDPDMHSDAKNLIAPSRFGQKKGFKVWKGARRSNNPSSDIAVN